MRFLDIFIFIFRPVILAALGFLGYSLCALSVFTGSPVLITLGFVSLAPLMIEILFEIIIEPYSGFNTIHRYLQQKKG